MINILNKYYGIKIDYYKKYNEGIIFFVNGDYFYFFNTQLSEKDIRENNFVTFFKIRNIMLHQFIINNYGDFVSEGYILIKLNHLIDEISFKELENFNVSISKKADIGFYDKWVSRLDYLEKQLTELSDNKFINNSFDYFVGIAEQLLGFIKDNYDDSGESFVIHQKFNLNTIDFYNPVNVTIGNEFNDIASYIHIKNDWNLLSNILDKINTNDKVYLFVKLAFPFEYFRAINLYITGDESKFELISSFVNNIEQYERYLTKISYLFGYNIFYWIKKDN